ncbi:Regulator of rDNA transcription protein 15 [Capsicum baccatum]|uniref:Regulator of rDNA transcription protein 15 n=1 Tax=Capsicum baccatum TaxID=33114 RepID=A0A2G2V7C5_CAPBA|nr:Regulator of rDNA transcription protein 15 [Capsicum baccatum]
MPHSESRKSSNCDAFVFRERPLDIVCLTVWNGTHATLEKQEADSGEVSSQHSVGFFKDGCTNLLWRRAAGWLDWMGRDEPERQRAESQWIVAARPLCHLQYPVTYKGSLGHAFTVRIRTGNENQKSFYPSVPHQIYVLVELILGHLRYLLTDVPPQPNSPPGNVFLPDRPADRIPLVRTSSELAVRRAGKAPEGTVPSPSPGRHAATRSGHRISSSNPPTADVFRTGTPVPSPQSQSFSQTYESILPTSLAYIVPSTKGCSPWRPNAVMSTIGCGRHLCPPAFQGPLGAHRTPRDVRCSSSRWTLHPTEPIPGWAGC